MPRALEERMHNLWVSDLKSRTFKNKKIKKVFKKLDIWRMLSYALIDDIYKKRSLKSYGGKKRLVFENEFRYLSDISGEYLLLARDLLSIFSRGRMPVFVKNFPIFVKLKCIPVFWINGEIITLWDFFFPLGKIDVLFKEVMRFSDKIIVFPRLEFASFNFIQTYSSIPRKVLSFDFLQKKNPKILNILEKYLIRNFWLIPDTNILDANPFSFVFFKDGQLLPCIPHRVIFKISKVRRARAIYLLRSKIKCLEISIKYFNTSGHIERNVIYYPKRLFKLGLEKDKTYNGLIFTFVDFDKEWLYPILFSFYEEDLHSFEIFQELLLIFFKKRYIKSQTLCSIHFNEGDLWDEFQNFSTILWRERILPDVKDVFLNLEKRRILELLLSELYPMLVKSNNHVFYVPLSVALLNLKRKELIKLMKWYEDQKWGLDVHSFLKIGDIIKFYPEYRRFVKNLKTKVLLTKYVKRMIVEMWRLDNDG